MKKLSLVLALAIVALLFASCKKENKLEQQIIGKWMIADMNGQSMQTNEKKVYTFVSATKAYVSASLNSNPDIASIWDVEMEAVTDREFQ